jgi:hypothetical protein
MSRAAFHTAAVHSGNFAQLRVAVGALHDFYDQNEADDRRAEFVQPRASGFCRECHHSFGHAIGCPEHDDPEVSE